MGEGNHTKQLPKWRCNPRALWLLIQDGGTRLQAPVDFVKLPQPRELVLCQILNHSSPTGNELLSNLPGSPGPHPPWGLILTGALGKTLIIITLFNIKLLLLAFSLIRENANIMRHFILDLSQVSKSFCLDFHAVPS